MSQVKPVVSVEVVQKVIQSYFGKDAEIVEALDGGNIDRVFSAVVGIDEYIIRFSVNERAFVIDEYLSNLLSANCVQFSKVLRTGKVRGELEYCLAEKIKSGTYRP